VNKTSISGSIWGVCSSRQTAMTLMRILTTQERNKKTIVCNYC